MLIKIDGESKKIKKSRNKLRAKGLNLTSTYYPFVSLIQWNSPKMIKS